MKNLIFVILMLLSTTALAVNTSDVNIAGWDKLTDVQKAEVLKHVATAAEQSSKPKTNDPMQKAKEINEWVDVGANIGKGLAGAAKELGVQANDFVQTPVGKMAAILIFWNYMGQDVAFFLTGAFIHFTVGVLILLIGISISNRVVKLNSRVEEVYDVEKTDIFGRSRLQSRDIPAINSETLSTYIIIIFITLCVSLITIFTF